MWGERWRRNASSLRWWVRKAGAFHDESRKRTPLYAGGQGGSVAGDVDNLSPQRPLAALCPNLRRKWGETGRYFPPSFIAAIARRSLAQSLRPANTLLFMIWLRDPFFPPSLLFWCYLPFVYISFRAACETWEQRCALTTLLWDCLLFLLLCSVKRFTSFTSCSD